MFFWYFRSIITRRCLFRFGRLSRSQFKDFDRRRQRLLHFGDLRRYGGYL